MRKRPAHITLPMIRRMQALRDAGLSLEAVRRVVELDYGDAPCTLTIQKYTRSPLTGTGFTPGGPGGFAGLGHTPAKRGPLVQERAA